MKSRFIKGISKSVRPDDDARELRETDVEPFRDAGGVKRRVIKGISKPIPAPISIRLDDDVRETLETEARSRGVGLGTLLRQIATEAAMRLRRERIRRQSKAVGDYVASSAEAAEFYEEWGTPRAEEP